MRTRCRNLAFLAILLSVVSLSSAITSPSEVVDDFDSEGVNTKVGQIFRNLPRRDLHWHKVNSTWDPQSVEYYESLGVISSPFLFGFAIAILGGLIASIFYCTRLCRFDQEARFSRGQIICTRFILILLSIILILCAALCGFANWTLHTSFDSAIDEFKNTETTMYDDLDNIYSTLSGLDSLNDSLADPIKLNLEDFMTSSNETKDDADFYMREAKTYEIYREAVMFSVCGLLCVAAITGILAASCSSRHAAFWNSQAILLFLIPLSCILIAVNTFGGVFVADMCPAIDGYILNQTQDADQAEWIEYYLTCENQTENPLYAASNQIRTEIVIMTAQLEWKERDPNTPAEEIMGMELIIQKLTELRDQVNSLANCTRTEDAWDNAKDEICHHVLDAFAFQIFAILVSIIVLAFLVGFGFSLHKKLGPTARLYSRIKYEEEPLLGSDISPNRSARNSVAFENMTIPTPSAPDMSQRASSYSTFKGPQSTPGSSNLNFIRTSMSSTPTDLPPVFQSLNDDRPPYYPMVNNPFEGRQ